MLKRIAKRDVPLKSRRRTRQPSTPKPQAMPAYAPSPYKEVLDLTDSHRKAGIVDIHSRNYNGSYQCTVDLRKVDLQNMQSNPRRHSQAHGNRLAANWFQAAVRNPILRYGEKCLTSIDGRHTSTELLRRGDNIVTAEVHFGISHADAARVFHELAMNGKRLPCWDAYTCALMAGMKHAVDIDACLSKYNLIPKLAGIGKTRCDVVSYSAVMEAWEASGGLLDKVFYILDKVYRSRVNSRVVDIAQHVDFVRGLIDICSDPEFRSWSAQRWVAILRSVDVHWLSRRAQRHAERQHKIRLTRLFWYCAFMDAIGKSGRLAA